MAIVKKYEFETGTVLINDEAIVTSPEEIKRILDNVARIAGEIILHRAQLEEEKQRA